ncbi:hypothetical protein ABIC65_003380 [Sphingomonas trueperi]|uniref:Mu transposase C-terminal domain-containing protein n=1 Tax=Sphingomonas trueperi TaxID=53317 RepID=UPI003396F271
MHGRPDEIYVDNGADFHSEAVERGCALWGMKINYRPPGRPHYGGIVERAFRTAMESLRTLPGATGRSIKDRGERQPHKTAALTLGELEEHFTRFFSQEYHRREHSGIGMSPFRKWMTGIFGDDGSSGCGLPIPVDDPGRLLLDFLPLARRRVTRSGIAWDRINYMDDILKPYIGRDYKEPFIVRRDPRDISRIWLLSPDDGKYHPIRTRSLTTPCISLWDLHEARKIMKVKGTNDFDEAQIFLAIEELQKHSQESTKKTSVAKRARMAKERRNRNSRIAPPVQTTPIDQDDTIITDDFNDLNIFDIED